MHPISCKEAKNKIKLSRSVKKEDSYFVCFLKLSITGAPIVKLGTKCLNEIEENGEKKGNMFSNFMTNRSHIKIVKFNNKQN